MFTDDQKVEIINDYRKTAQTAEFDVNTAIALAKKYETSPNLIRMILKDANLYEPAKPEAKKKVSRTNKAAAQQSLVEAIQATGYEVSDEEALMITRLTGKACIFFTKIISGDEE